MSHPIVYFRLFYKQKLQLLQQISVKNVRTLYGAGIWKRAFSHNH